MVTEGNVPEEHSLTPIRGARAQQEPAGKNTSRSAPEREEIQPLSKTTGEVSLKLQEAKTSHWVAMARYYGGIGIIALITSFSLYIFAFENKGPAYGDAVKLLFLIAGAIVGSIYASTNNGR